MYKLDVYFDYVDIGNDIEVGALIEDDGEVVDSYLEVFKNVKHRGNNYHFSILAWSCAVKMVNKYIEEEGDVFDKISFYNQNQLIFKWAEEGKCPADYEKGISKLYEEVRKIVEKIDIEFSFKTIKGKDNKVKKILRKRKDKKMSTTEQKMSFGNILGNVKKDKLVESKMIKDDVNSNVVNMFDIKKANEA